MNIDEEKLIMRLTTHDQEGYEAHRQSLEKMLKDCEIKPADCDKCTNRCPVSGDCLNPECIDLPGRRSYFKPPVNELDKLFIGAPMMVHYHKRQPTPSIKLDTFHGWKNKVIVGDSEHYVQGLIRLPTVKELLDNKWVNKWFAPWETMPEELKELRFQVWFKSGNLTIYEKGVWVNINNWPDVKAIQILEDW